MDEITALKGKSHPEQSIRQHTDLLKKAFRQYLSLYPDAFDETEKRLIELAAEYHDYGKSIYPFQKLVGNGGCVPEGQRRGIEDFYRKYANKTIPHGCISASCLDMKALQAEFSSEQIRLLATAVYHHHARDCFLTMDDINGILDADLRKRYPQHKFYAQNKNKPYGEENDFDWCQYAVVKGMLNRLDYWASAGTDADFEIDPKDERHGGRTVAQLVEQKLISEYRSLRDVQTFMRAHTDDNLAVTASTGIGKTEAALMWIGGSKAFYTLPLIVSINEIYKRICGCGYGAKIEDIEKENKTEEEGKQAENDKVTLLHSDAVAYLMQTEEAEDDSLFTKIQATRLFSYPLTVCTVDQLFTFVYKYHGCEQFLATLKYAKLVIDEIQAYSPDLTAKIIYGLKLIADAGGKFAIITATLPPVVRHFMEKTGFVFIDAKDPDTAQKAEQAAHDKKHVIRTAEYLSETPRHWLAFAPYAETLDFDYAAITERAKTQKVLVLCNTVKKAQDVYEKLRREYHADPFLLHGQFIRKHRRMIETKIMEFSAAENEVGIWISTQIVEASLDIDFDVLFTEMSTADSLLQRLGRCRRKRAYTQAEPNVYIYDTRNNYIYDDEIYKRSVDLLQRYLGKIFKEEDKLAYINAVFDAEALKDTAYYKTLSKNLQQCRYIPFGGYDKETAIKKLRDIDTRNFIPECIHNNHRTEIEQWLGILDKRAPKMAADQGKERLYQDKVLAQNALRELTLPIYKFGAKTKWADKQPIAPKMEIYRINAEYVFDEETCKGAGLLDGDDAALRYI